MGLVVHDRNLRWVAVDPRDRLTRASRIFPAWASRLQGVVPTRLGENGIGDDRNFDRPQSEPEDFKLEVTDNQVLDPQIDITTSASSTMAPHEILRSLPKCLAIPASIPASPPLCRLSLARSR